MGKQINLGSHDIDSAALYLAMSALNQTIKSFKPELNLLGSIADHHETFALYDSYPIEKRKKIFEDFSTYAQTLNSSMFEAFNKNRNKSLTWGALKTLKLRFDDDLFEELSDEDIVEIYRYDNLQMFRNLKFHEVCSFHFPELFIKQWPELFDRDRIITKQIMESAIATFSSSNKKPILTDHIPEHDLVEIRSPEVLRMKMTLKALYPLKDKTGRVPYILAVSRVKLKDKRRHLDYSNVYTI